MQVLYDQMPYNDVANDMAVISRIKRGDPPLDMKTIVIDKIIRRLFRGCWVKDPGSRIDIKACETAVKGALTRVQST